MSASKDPVDEWVGKLIPTMAELMSTLEDAQGIGSRGPAAILATADQIEAMSKTGRRWLASHPCPRGDIDGSLEKLLKHYGVFATELRDQAARPEGPDVQWIDDGLRALFVETARGLAQLSDSA